MAMARKALNGIKHKLKLLNLGDTSLPMPIIKSGRDIRLFYGHELYILEHFKISRWLYSGKERRDQSSKYFSNKKYITSELFLTCSSVLRSIKLRVESKVVMEKIWSTLDPGHDLMGITPGDLKGQNEKINPLQQVRKSKSKKSLSNLKLLMNLVSFLIFLSIYPFSWYISRSDRWSNPFFKAPTSK